MDLNHTSGGIVEGWTSVVQSMQTILTTRINTRPFLRAFGSEVPELIDAPLNEISLMELYVAVAEAFLGTPYLWGGKESLGLDCSGLLQMALAAAGVVAPRDADQQEAFLQEIWRDVTSEPDRRRGDVVFWPGHVGIMTDSEHLLHANAHTMDTTLEDFREAEARIAAKENPVRSIFRPG